MSRRQQTQGNRIVASDELHQKYAPVMHFARGERFFPMSVDDFLTYTALYVKGQHTPVIPRGRVVLDDLTHRYSSRETFLRSVATGPIRGAEIASEWGVAAGSHASYPEAKQYPLVALYNLIDYATGESFTLDHDGWRGRINLGKVPWLSAYLGSWGTRYWLPLEWAQKTLGLLVSSIPGEVDLPGVSAPRGPKFGDEGGEREIWRNPVAFAGIP